MFFLSGFGGTTARPQDPKKKALAFSPMKKKTKKAGNCHHAHAHASGDDPRRKKNIIGLGPPSVMVS